MLKLKSAFALFLFFFAIAPAHAVDPARKTGLGLILGEPTGLSAKFWLDQAGDGAAVDAAFAYSFGEYGLLVGDYLLHQRGFFGSGSEFSSNLVAYYGFGGFFLFGSHHKSSTVGIGGRVPLGAEWLAPKDPFGVGLEIVPGIRLAPATSLVLHVALTGRFYF